MKDLFDEFFSSRGLGKRFDLQTWPRPDIFEHFIELANYVIELIHSGAPYLPKPYIDILDNTTLNACATKIAGRYVIAIHMGTILLHHEIFYRMLSHRDTFPDIGDPSLESRKNKVFDAQITDFATLYFMPGTEEIIIPKDKIRLRIGQVFEDLVLVHLIAHEYAHIIFGHVDYLATLQINPTIYENPNIENELGVDPLILQTLEMDADRFAARIGVAFLELYQENSDNLHPELRQFYSNWPDLIKYWDIATYTSKRLFGSGRNNLANYKNLTHPLPGLRQIISVLMMTSIFETKFDASFTKQSIIINQDATLAVESAFDSISEQADNVDSFMFAFTAQGREHLHLICTNWNKVRLLLEPFAMEELYPCFP
jgi:hypothetical protein